MGVRPFFWMLVCLLPAGEGLAQTVARERVVESIVPWLDYNSSCWPAVELKNLGNREVAAEVEAVGVHAAKSFKLGDRVMGIVGGGGYAEFARLNPLRKKA